MRRTVRLAVAVLALAAPVLAEPGWEDSFEKALALAAAAKKPLLIDFTAPWCYSCYYMEKNVLSRPAFARASEGLVLLKVDVDREAGRRLQSERRVSFLPSFLVLDGAGKELGRIIGENAEADFLAQLEGIAGPGVKAPEDRALDAFAGQLRRREYAEAAALRKTLELDLAKALAGRQDWTVLSARLDLKLDKRPEAFEVLLERNQACDLPYDVLAGLELKPPAPLVAKARERLEAWARDKVFGPKDSRCADFRSGVEALAEVYAAASDAPARAALLDKTVALLEAESAEAGIGADRNLDDNLRYFLDEAGEDPRLESLYPKLVEAYPSDYVYAQRFAKWLAGKKRHAQALPWIEKAARLCYGLNRLSVSRLQAEILSELGRKPEAAAILRRELKAYARSFPKEARPLRELLARIEP